MKKRATDYLNTRDAAAHLGLSTRTLDRYRVSGDGPVFLKFGGRVRYLREDLDEWARTRRRKSTSDDGTGERPALPAPDAPGFPSPGPRSGKAGRKRGKRQAETGDPAPGAAR